MKKLLLAACFVIGATAMSFAQGGGGGGRQMPTPAERAKQLQTALTLNDDQTAKVTAIYAAQQVKQDSIMKVANGDFQSQMPAFQAMRTATTAKIKALLTADQAKAFDAMPQRGMGGRGGQGGGGRQGGQGGGTPPPPPPAK